MPTIGVDAHQAWHVAVAINATGEQVGAWRGANHATGWAALLAWATGLGAVRRWSKLGWLRYAGWPAGCDWRWAMRTRSLGRSASGPKDVLRRSPRAAASTG